MKKAGTVLALLCLVIVADVGVAGDVEQGRIKTTTVGTMPPPSRFFSSLFGAKYGAVSPDAPKWAARLATLLSKQGYRLYEPSEITRNSDVFVIIRDYRGKSADYLPQTSEVGSRGGWGSALVSLGLGGLIGKNLGVVNTHNPLMSDANTVANLVRQTGDAYGNPGQNEDRAKATEGVKDERNLVAFRLCFRGQCAYALSAGDASLDDLEEGCFRDGILKLAGLEE
ncbi:MAG: hypothetical protein HZB71_05530 [Betaproteobacteria bacterium]|nr:hypothetical protein [Betaproteobacteria bacterium]